MYILHGRDRKFYYLEYLLYQQGLAYSSKMRWQCIYELYMIRGLNNGFSISIWELCGGGLFPEYLDVLVAYFILCSFN